jgi:flavin reductase (DIM6/NTAB) family NADH-FMN oxidoreductase RutF
MKFSPLSPSAFRRVCAKYSTGVAIASVTGAGGVPLGLTINSFTSVSLTPPLVLICIDLNSTAIRHFRYAKSFAISVLAENQQALSVRFARKGHHELSGIECSPGTTGAPILDGALAVLDCRVTRRLTVGDHIVLIGEVVAASRRKGRPLIFFESGYHALR